MKIRKPSKIYAESASRKHDFTWQCGICSRKFTRRASLQYHCDKYHKGEKRWIFIRFKKMTESGEDRNKGNKI